MLLQFQSGSSSLRTAPLKEQLDQFIKLISSMKNRKTKSVMKSRHFKAVTSSFVLFNYIFHPPALSTGIFFTVNIFLQKNDRKLSNPTSCSWEAIASSNSRLATKYNYDNQLFTTMKNLFSEKIYPANASPQILAEKSDFWIKRCDKGQKNNDKK